MQGERRSASVRMFLGDLRGLSTETNRRAERHGKRRVIAVIAGVEIAGASPIRRSPQGQPAGPRAATRPGRWVHAGRPDRSAPVRRHREPPRRNRPSAKRSRQRQACRRCQPARRPQFVEATVERPRSLRQGCQCSLIGREPGSQPRNGLAPDAEVRIGGDEVDKLVQRMCGLRDTTGGQPCLTFCRAALRKGANTRTHTVEDVAISVMWRLQPRRQPFSGAVGKGSAASLTLRHSQMPPRRQGAC